ncbi:MAG: hypothetical protein ACRD0H_11805 [Actinomycetes bacterium]
MISFYVIVQFWLVHHRVFRRITGQQEGLAHCPKVFGVMSDCGRFDFVMSMV